MAATNHGTFWVDYFPILKHVPSKQAHLNPAFASCPIPLAGWFPGAGFKRKAKIWAGYSRDLVDIPWEWLKVSIVSIASVNQPQNSTNPSFQEDGKAPSSISTKSLERLSVTAGDGSYLEGVIKNSAAIAYIGKHGLVFNNPKNFLIYDATGRSR